MEERHKALEPCHRNGFSVTLLPIKRGPHGGASAARVQGGRNTDNPSARAVARSRLFVATSFALGLEAAEKQVTINRQRSTSAKTPYGNARFRRVWFTRVQQGING